MLRFLTRFGTALLVLLATLVHAQDSQFVFDANGNLLAQTAEASAPPQILGQPQNQVVEPGAAASFFVVAADTRALSYQWRFNGIPLGGSATNDALLLQNVSTNNEGQYSVVLTNSSGSVTSAPAMLWFDGNGNGIGDSWELAYFGNLTNTATADFDGDGISNLQEFLDGTNPTNSASAFFRLTVQSDDGGTWTANPPGRLTYTNGETVTLTATAFAPHTFHAWTGETNTRGNSITLTMTGPKTVRAYFNPIDFVWTNFASGDWDVATNWTPNLAPGLDDSVIIPGGATVTLNTPADCADVTLGGTGSPTLTLSNDLTVRGNLLWTAGTINGSGNLTARGNFSWTAGTRSGSGRTIMPVGATLTLANPSDVILNTHTIENGGTVLWTGTGGIVMNNGAVLTNRAGALFEMQTAVTITANNGACRFDNAGTFRKSINSGTTTFFGTVSFNNSGTVDVQTGILSLTGGGTHTGSFTVPAGAVLNLSSTHIAGASSSVTGAGQLTVSGGTVTLAGLVNVSGSNTFSGGTANLTGNYICTNNTVTISGGTATFSGAGLVSPAVVNLSSGTLGGTSTVTVNTAMNWTGGTMNDAGRLIIPAGAGLQIANPGAINLNSHTLENAGTALWTGAGGMVVNSGAVISNRSRALFEMQNAVTITANNGACRFDNAGTFRKSVNSGTTTFFGTVGFNNSGTVDIQTGTLNLGGGGTHSGSFTVPAGTALNLAGTHTAAGSSSITGAGQLTVSGGTVTLAGLVNVSGSNTFSGGTANLTGNYICTNNTATISGGTATFSGTGLVSPAMLNLSSGTLGGTSTVTVNTAMNWTGGTMNDAGRLIIPAGAGLQIANPGAINLNSHTLENAGTALWTGAGSIVMNPSAVITNRPGALFEIQNSVPIVANNGFCRIDNAGTFRKTVNPGTTTIPGFVGFNNFGTVDIRSGILAAGGGYASSSSALLNCALGGTTAGAGYGQLQVSGTATLNGALSVDLLPGFSPATNDTFTVLTAGARNNTFASFSYASNRVTMLLSNSPSSVVLRVTDVLPIPQPVLMTPTLVGSNALLTWTATSNVAYRLEFNPALTNLTNWSAIAGDVTTLSNTASKLDLLTPSNRLYRVRVLP